APVVGFRSALDRGARGREIDQAVVERARRAGLEERHREGGDVALAPRPPGVAPALGRWLGEEHPPSLREARQQELLAGPEVAPAHLGEDDQVHYEAGAPAASAWRSAAPDRGRWCRESTHGDGAVSRGSPTMKRRAQESSESQRQTWSPIGRRPAR